MGLMEEIVERVARIEKELMEAPGWNIASGASSKGMEEVVLQEKKYKAQMMTKMDKVANRLNRMEGQLRSTIAEKGDKGVVDEVSTRVHQIERKIDENTPQEKRFKGLLMSVLDGIATRVERIENEMKDATLETRENVPLTGKEMTAYRLKRMQMISGDVSIVLDEIANRVERIEKEIRAVLLEKEDKRAVNKIANRLERIETEMSDAQLKIENRASLAVMLDETANRLERIEKEMKSVLLKKGDKVFLKSYHKSDIMPSPFQSAVDEVAYHVERMEKEMMGVTEAVANRVERLETEVRHNLMKKTEKAKLTNELDEVAQRVEHIERELRVTTLEKGDKVLLSAKYMFLGEVDFEELRFLESFKR
ncbi:unnamed protein product [Cylicostephanus goldi]|uniref:Uncharacterized protein n=1 Tax=Cylicostephanus goldi TaxID=71465 RepID=A0A3P6QZ68_CYLGO|nr:unnamed protein product [Cylicostephanus goldi]